MKHRLRVPRGAEDVREQLREQIGLLQSVCKVYDDGNKDLAKFMAVTLRLLLHQTNTSHALLEQLGLRNGRFFEWNYAGPRHPNGRKLQQVIPGDWKVELDGVVGDGSDATKSTLVAPITSSCRLAVAFNSRDGSEFIAPLSSLGRQTKKRFSQWWSDEVVRDLRERVFSRRDLILEIANTDGGAHVDPELEERYLDFSRKNSLGWGFSHNGRDWQAISAPHIPCMRQIAHEVLITLHDTASWAFKKLYTFEDPFQGREGYSIGSIVLEVRK